MPYLQQLADGSLLLSLHVQPRARKNEISAIHAGAVKLRLTTPPVDGRANRAVTAFLAGELDLAKSAVTIKSGAGSRNKRVLIQGCDEDKVRAMVNAWLEKKST